MSILDADQGNFTAVVPSDSAAPTNAASAPKNQDDLERVRELILGPDKLSRLDRAEADRLRQIIFGTHMQEYERHFADLRRETERVLSDLRLSQDHAQDFERIQTTRLENLERETLQTLDELRREINKLRAQETLVQQLLTQVRQQELLNQTTAQHAEELDKGQVQHERELRTLKMTINENRDYHERKWDALRREMRQGLDELQGELRRLIDRLDHQKTDRKALAAMLIEVATRLETGSNVTGLLKELSGSSQE
jgi:hypothetical protein